MSIACLTLKDFQSKGDEAEEESVGQVNSEVRDIKVDV